jgi:hypothetical protein
MCDLPSFTLVIGEAIAAADQLVTNDRRLATNVRRVAAKRRAVTSFASSMPTRL